MRLKRTEVDPTGMQPDAATFRILNRLKEGIEDDVVQAIADRLKDNNKCAEETGNLLLKASSKEAAHKAAVETLNEVLLPAMKEVGDKFGAGELILPFVLKSAECMKADRCRAGEILDQAGRSEQG